MATPDPKYRSTGGPNTAWRGVPATAPTGPATTITELLDDNGISADGFQAALEAARPLAIQDAITKRMAYHVANSHQVRYCNSAANGLGNGTTAATSGANGAWKLAQLQAELNSRRDDGVRFLGNSIGGSADITNIASTTGISAGDDITGFGIPYGTKVQTVVSSSRITLTNAVTETNTQTAYCASPAAGMYVYMDGHFTPSTYVTGGSTAACIRVNANNVTLDFDTYSAKVSGKVVPTWVGPTAAGEYYFVLSGGELEEAQFRLCEDGVQMGCLNAGDDLNHGRAKITAASITDDSVTAAAPHAWTNGDKVALVGSAAGGLSPGTQYYVVQRAGNTIKLATTPGGSPVPITSTALVNKYLFTTHSAGSNQFGIPNVGLLEPGQCCYAPGERRIYMKPSSGAPGSHEYTLWFSNNNSSCVQVSRNQNNQTRNTNCAVIGGEMWGSVHKIMDMGGGENTTGVASTLNGADDCYAIGVYAHDGLDGINHNVGVRLATISCIAQRINYHSLGSRGASQSRQEPNQRVIYSQILDMDAHDWTEGDMQSIVTNPICDDYVFFGNLTRRMGRPRNRSQHPLTGVRYPSGLITDDSARGWRAGNYYCEYIGWAFDATASNAAKYPPGTSSGTDWGNVIDARNNPLYMDLLYMGSLPFQMVRLSNGGKVSPAGGEYVSKQNMFVLGNMLNVPSGATFDPAVVGLRYSAPPPNYTLSIEFKNNIIVATDNAKEWTVFAIRYSAGAGTVSKCVVISDNNTFINIPSAVDGYRQFTQVSNQTAASIKSVAQVCNGWTRPHDGGINDRNSDNLTISQGTNRVREWVREYFDYANGFTNLRAKVNAAMTNGYAVPPLGEVGTITP